MIEDRRSAAWLRNRSAISLALPWWTRSPSARMLKGRLQPDAVDFLAGRRSWPSSRPSVGEWAPKEILAHRLYNDGVDLTIR
jgi:hypothetical protein